MIEVKDIYAASNNGLDIILYYYPQASGCVDNKKHFDRTKMTLPLVSRGSAMCIR